MAPVSENKQTKETKQNCNIRQWSPTPRPFGAGRTDCYPGCGAADTTTQLKLYSI